MLLLVAKFEIVGVVEVVKVRSALFVSFHLALLYHHFTSSTFNHLLTILSLIFLLPAFVYSVVFFRFLT